MESRSSRAARGHAHLSDNSADRRARGRRPIVKVRAVEVDNRRRSFRVASDRGVFDFPYAKTYPPLARNERVNSAWPDPELGNEAFTFQLESGREDSVHMDSVLEYNEDPETLQRILLHRLTVEAKQAVREGSLSKRELVRRL